MTESNEKEQALRYLEELHELEAAAGGALAGRPSSSESQSDDKQQIEAEPEPKA